MALVLTDCGAGAVSVRSFTILSSPFGATIRPMVKGGTQAMAPAISISSTQVEPGLSTAMAAMENPTGPIDSGPTLPAMTSSYLWPAIGRRLLYGGAAAQRP